MRKKTTTVSRSARRKILFSLGTVSACLFAAPVLSLPPLSGGQDVVLRRDLAVPMRDGVVLSADLLLPADPGRFPVLVYRTPYGRPRRYDDGSIFCKAVRRGYAVVIQDVRGRYGSGGEFNPYFQEGRDGYDTIEWAARQIWSSGAIGTFGLSYPGAVQWLAALESPPSLKAMVPAMTYSTPRSFFYFGGVFDGSWIAWAWNNIAPDARARKGLAGPRTVDEARAAWPEFGDRAEARLPLNALFEFRDCAPWYFDWLAHPPEDPWWDPLDLRETYHRSGAAVLNLSGWYDEAYGPEGAASNFSGLVASRNTWDDPRVRLVIGPWAHGVPSTSDSSVGERDFGPRGVVDYDELVLRWMDRYVRGSENGVEFEPRVRAFLMGRNAWVESSSWPIPGGKDLVLYLDGTALPGRPSLLSRTAPGGNGSRSSFVSDPAQPVRDPYPPNSGAHDYAALLDRSDVLAWETPPLQSDVSVLGRIEAVLYVSCDAPDADIWVKLLDVGPDGKAMSLMSPGLDVLRMSYRDPSKPQLLESGKVYEIRLGNLMTGNTFRKGHRIRIQVSGSFFPNFSRNLHTGKRETESGEMRRARITLHHHPGAPSRIRLPLPEP